MAKRAKVTINMGVSNIQKMLSTADVSLLSKPEPMDAFLSPSHVDLLVQTTCPPEIPVDPYLHGLEFSSRIELVFRNDMPRQPDADKETCISVLTLCPPRSEESMSVSYAAFRRWIQYMRGDKKNVVITSDLVGSDADFYDSDNHRFPKWLYAIKWLGKNESQFITNLLQVRPGDVLVMEVPGGEEGNPTKHLNFFDDNWFPGQLDKDPEEPNAFLLNDIGDNDRVVRLHPQLINPWNSCYQDEDLRKELFEIIAKNNKQTIIERLRKIPRFAEVSDVKRHPNGGWVALFKNDKTFNSNGPVELIAHNLAARNWVNKFINQSSHPALRALKINLLLAAWFHDIGKLDPRFQMVLRRGQISEEDTILAKSTDNKYLSWEEQLIIRERSGWPTSSIWPNKSARHELNSVQLLQANPHLLDKATKQLMESDTELQNTFDRELVLYLIGSHHGQNRPFAFGDPAIVGDYEYNGQKLTVKEGTSLDDPGSACCERFWNLISKYGWWTLSWFESIVMLADHRASEGQHE